MQMRAAPPEHCATDEDKRLYQSMIGALMFAALGTRPDIAYAVTRLSQYTSNPLPEHIHAVKRVLRYLRGSEDLGIVFRGSKVPNAQVQLTAFCDSDWAANVDDRRSVTGYVMTLCGGAISWKSKKQSTVALSTVEAEYMAASAAAQEVIWWRRFLSGLQLRHATMSATPLYSDNQGSIALAHNPQNHERTKHIDIRYHFLRECVESDVIDLRYVSTNNMPADVLTKALTHVKHQQAIQAFGMRTVQLEGRCK